MLAKGKTPGLSVLEDDDDDESVQFKQIHRKLIFLIVAPYDP